MQCHDPPSHWTRKKLVRHKDSGCCSELERGGNEA